MATTPDFDYEITQGDFGKVMKMTLLGADGERVDLTAVDTVKIYVGDARTGALVVDGGECTVDANQNPPDAEPPGNRGVVYYTWAEGDTDTPGVYEATVKARWAIQRLTHPTDPRLRINIKRELGS